MQRGGKIFVTTAVLAIAACAGEQGKLQIRPTPSALAQGSRPVPVRIAEARGQLALGNVALALESFRKARREDPNSIDALVGMAACYDRMGRFELSRRNYEAALALAPADMQLLGAFAASLQLQGKADEALKVRREMAARLGAPAAQPKPQQQQQQQQQQLAAAVPAAEPQKLVKAAPVVPLAAPQQHVEAARVMPVLEPQPQAAAAPAIAAAQAAPVASPPQPVRLATAAAQPQPAASPQPVKSPPAQAAPSVTMKLPPARIAAAPEPVTVKDPPAPVAVVANRVSVEAPPVRVAAAAEAVAAQRPTAPVAAAPESVTVKLPPARPAAVAARMATNRRERGPRLERLSMAEIALVTTPGPVWRPAVVARDERSTTVRWVPLRQASTQSARVRLLNAARVNRLAARTHAWLAARGWRRMAIGDAPAMRTRSLIVYPAGQRALAQRLSNQFGFAIEQRSDVKMVTMLLGRDAARIEELRPQSA